MTLEEKFEEYKEEGIAEGHSAGLQEGEETGRLDAIRKMLTKLSEEDILSLGFSKDDIAAAKE